MQTVEYVAPEKILCRVPGPTLQGNPAAKGAPSTTRSCGKNTRTYAANFFVKQLVNQMCLRLQRERDTHSWWEDCALRENPPYSDIKKESLEWQKASERHALDFFPERMHEILLELHQLMSKCFKKLSILTIEITYMWFSEHNLIDIVHQLDHCKMQLGAPI